MCLHMAYGQNRQIDSLLALIRTDKADTNKVKHLNDLGWQMKNSNPDTSILFSLQALHLAEKLRASPEKATAKAGKISIATSYGHLGVYNYLKTNYSEALTYYFKALKLFEELGYKNRIAPQLSNIGIVYNDQAIYPKALEYFFKALKMHEELGNKDGIAISIGNIGNVYNNQTVFPKALEYYFKALKMNEENGNKKGIATNLGNIGNVYSNQDFYPQALEYYFKALKMQEEIGNKGGIAANLSNIGIVYTKQADRSTDNNMKQKLFTKALNFYFKALQLYEEVGNKNGIALNHGNMGALYTKTGNFTKSESYLKYALALYDTLGLFGGVMETNLNLSQLYDTTGKVKLAFEHYKKYIAVRDSINSEENQKKQVRTEINHEFEKKEALAKAEQDKKDLIAEEEKQKQKLFLWFTICGLAMVVVVSGFIFRSLQINKKKNKIISQQKNLVEHQKKVVEEKQKEILDSIHYAKRIQTALLTSEKYINRNLNRLK